MVPKLTRIEVFPVSNLPVLVTLPVRVVVQVQRHLALLSHHLLNWTDLSCLRARMKLVPLELVPMLNFEFRLEFEFFRLAQPQVGLVHQWPHRLFLKRKFRKLFLRVNLNFLVHSKTSILTVSWRLERIYIIRIFCVVVWSTLGTINCCYLWGVLMYSLKLC